MQSSIAQCHPLDLGPWREARVGAIEILGLPHKPFSCGLISPANKYQITNRSQLASNMYHFSSVILIVFDFVSDLMPSILSGLS